MTVYFILLLIASYFSGSIPSAYLMGKWFRGIDIRKFGSGNVGVSNLIHATSVPIALPAIVIDLAKGIVPLWIANVIGLGLAQQAAIAAASVIGHNWSIFLNFNSGRGALTTLGVTLFLPLFNGYFPWEIIAFFAIMIPSLLIFHNIPVGFLVSMATFPLVSWLSGKPLAITLGFVALLIILVVRRLAVPISPEAMSLSTQELLLNRLLYDRDIKDRESWLNRRAD